MVNLELKMDYQFLVKLECLIHALTAFDPLLIPISMLISKQTGNKKCTQINGGVLKWGIPKNHGFQYKNGEILDDLEVP